MVLMFFHRIIADKLILLLKLCKLISNVLKNKLPTMRKLSSKWRSPGNHFMCPIFAIHTGVWTGYTGRWPAATISSLWGTFFSLLTSTPSDRMKSEAGSSKAARSNLHQTLHADPDHHDSGVVTSFGIEKRSARCNWATSTAKFLVPLGTWSHSLLWNLI